MRRKPREGDADLLRSLRIMIETAASHYTQGIITLDQYNEIAAYVVNKIEELEEAYDREH